MQIRRRYNQRSKALLFPRRHFNKSHSTEPLFVLLMTTAFCNSKICIVIKTIKLNLLQYIPFTRLPLGSVRCADDTLLNIGSAIMWRAFICIGCSQTDVLPNTLGTNARHFPVSEKSRYICKSRPLRNKCCRVSEKCLNLATSRNAGKQRSQSQTRPRPPRLRTLFLPPVHLVSWEAHS